ncbi:tetratricopeptide repeat protein, partial [bacterium]|nr:tetratricopeptide repeat protein [bacterium]
MQTFFKSFTYLLTVALLTTWTGIANCQSTELKIPITTSSPEAKALYDQARDLQEKFHFPESREPLEAALQLDSDFALAHLLYAFTQPSNKGFLESLNNAVGLVDKVSEGEKLIILAQQAGVNGDPTQQGDYLLTLTEKFPQDERAQTALAVFYFGQQRYQDAIVHFTEATEAAPDFSPAYNMLGYSYRALEQYTDAEQAFKKYTELIPDEANPLDSYAELLLKMGRYDEALEAYRKTLQLDAAFVNSYVGAASVLTCMDRHAEALEELQQMVAAAVNDGQRRFALVSMANVYCDEGKFDDALRMIDEQYAIAEKINDVGAMAQDLTNTGNICFEAKRYDDALVNFTAAIEKIRASNLSDDIKANAERLFLFNEGRVALMKGEAETAKAKSMEFTEKANTAHNTFQLWLAHQL